MESESSFSSERDQKDDQMEEKSQETEKKEDNKDSDDIKEETQGPDFEIIGGASEDNKNFVRRSMEGKFQNVPECFADSEERKKLESQECEKTQTELDFINLANKEINKLMEQVDVEPFNIPDENYYLLPGDFYEDTIENGDTVGQTNYINQEIFLNSGEIRDNAVLFLNTIVHETFHLKGETVWEVEKVEDHLDMTSFRRGLSVDSSHKSSKAEGKYNYFTGVNEAITEKSSKQITQKLIETLPKLEFQRKFMNSEAGQKQMSEIAEENDISKDDIIWLGKEGGWAAASQVKTREVLDYVCEEVAEELSEKYKDSDEVFQEFLKAHFSGKLLDLARAIEETFGKGSFRTLGNMEPDENSGELHLKTLKKRRNEFLRKE